ncbi:hypothetical protein [Subsaximicrobium wynnwilliamsii]|uniref:hypothetical protein n=1 Tax=Subsaximicrobium wynnwilliamsii TaxID=291179 RepID=UPI001CB97339|nr:hypothetical protein [Subsaximicrobium wynnwilliamsii]
MSLWTPLIWLAIITPLLLIAQLTTKETNLKYLLLFAAYFLADAYLRILGFEIINLEFLNLNLNWSGTLLSLALALLFVFCLSKSIREDIGFTTNSIKEL